MDFNNIKAWPFQEARKILDRLNGKIPEKGYVLFETGYGPSGLPHIGTFAEVVRTVMVRQAFMEMSDIPTKLFVMSDDRDGLRKVPENIPNSQILKDNIGRALTSVPDPFGAYDSFGNHNNAMLRRFLDSFGFDYEFQSATYWYTSGRFDHMLIKMAEKYDALQRIMLPTLGYTRQSSYSIFMPVTENGYVLQVPIVKVDAKEKILVYKDEEYGTHVEIPLNGQNVKLQWKADWAGRWYAFDVDYEMFGKDLIPTAQLSRKINKAIGGKPPAGFNYELFLDINGEKISKTLGNGLSIEEWLTYGSKESLTYYMYLTPQRAKKLAHTVIPKCTDEFSSVVSSYNENDDSKYENPAWYVTQGNYKPVYVAGLTYGLLLNLIGTLNTIDSNIVLDYIVRYNPSATVQNHPYILDMVDGAIAYYTKYVKPWKVYRTPTNYEQDMLQDMANTLANMSDNISEETIQSEIYEVGKRYYQLTDLRYFFKAVYEILLGQSDGPRMGMFVKLYGRQNTINLINTILKGN